MLQADHIQSSDHPTHREEKFRAWILKWALNGSRIFVLIITFISALLLFHKSVTVDPGVNTNTASKIEDLYYGNAWKPLINRLLIPVSARILTYPIPQETRKKWAANLIQIPLVRQAFRSPNWNEKYVLEYVTVLLLMLLCLLGFLIAIRWLFVTVFLTHPLVSDFIPLISLFLLRPLIWPTTYPYDFATLMLTTLLIISTVKKAWLSYAIVFLFASLNKETSIVFIPFFAYFFRFVTPMPRLTYNRIILWQLGCWGIIKVVTHILYGNNGGENFWAVKNWSGHNPEVFMSYFPMGTFVAYFVLFVACTYQWRQKPLLIRQLFLALMWMLIPLHICIAWIDEIRSFYDAIPAAIILIAHSISLWLGTPLQPANQDVPAPGERSTGH